ncbi:ABC transporter ATP-binding protein [Sporomusa termitida]|uniref:Lipopolysaccharide export system ATP-binding protein LptB n=1 Tax=Sporomusa termitida TaxID=2377 RepID=A0A517DVR3_9FIRM|nr:ATP-binding cassette domain-containing protein [Sporomusa termitida]QDR81455.1 Lipopolysaccharide export system ATP-binding protein LptB [Sporomusa termitida]
MGSVLQVENLGISFGNHAVLKALTFAVQENEVLGVIGPNGAGKTVLLNILTGILQPTQGAISFYGENIIHKTITQRCRMGFGRTFQIPRPFEKMTVFENIVVGAVYGSRMSEAKAKGKAREIIEISGLGSKEDWFAGKLGLLDRKRLEIARALAGNTKLLLLDEVAGGLTDLEVTDILAIVKTVKAQGISIVWIEHVLRTMYEGTDRILCLAEGRNIACDLPAVVMQSPAVHNVYLGAVEA